MYFSLSPQARRELTRQYKQAFPPMGVYAVRCDAAGLLRLHSSRNVEGAMNRLRFELLRGTLRDKALQQAWNTHGADAFGLEVIERVKERDDPSFDYDSELASLLALWQAELQPSSGATGPQGGAA